MNQQVLTEATAWFIEFRSGQHNPAAQRDFMAWLRRSPDHIRAYLEISETYTRLPAAAAVPSKKTQELLERARGRLRENVVPLYNTGEEGTALTGSAVHSHRNAPRWPWAVAASLLLLVAAGAAVWTVWHRGLYTTEIAEQRTLTLSDGSRISLNAQTRLRVSYSKSERHIELLEGQALFDVAKDRGRPFIVRSGQAQVRAVGTRFDVHRLGVATTVTVLEGTVAVTQSESTNLTVSAGQQAQVIEGGNAAPRTANVAAATAWTRGQLEFDETPLSEVADDFNRFNGRRLVIESPALADFRISGVYASTDSASLILFLRSQPDLLVTETDTEIQVSRRGSPP
jgi:transmembrane sensor